MATGDRNKTPGVCADCGGEVAPGSGSLWWEAGPDDGGDVVGRTPAGWRVTHLDPAACAAERAERASVAEASRVERRRQHEAESAAEGAALRDQSAAIERLLAAIPACVAAGYHWDSSVIAWPGESVSAVALHRSGNPALAGVSLGHSAWTRHTAYDGSTAYVHSFGNASVLHATRAVVERAWAQWPNPAHYSQTPACDRWISACRDPAECANELAKYGPESPRVVEAREKAARGERVLAVDTRPCAGWERNAWVAGRLDLLRSEGVIE